MALFGFGKKKGDSGGDSSDGKKTATAEGFKPDPRKARAWFDRAHQVADTNHDYAIDAFTSGLKFEPENIKEWEALYEVGMRRLVSGGKPAGMALTMSSGGKTTIEKLTHAAKLWAMDPRNVTRAMAVLEKVTDMHVHEEDLDLGEVGIWVGEKTMELNAGKKASKAILVKAMNLFKDLKAYKQGVEACRRALAIADDGTLIQELRDMEALKAMVDSKMTGKEGAFKEGVADMKKQQAMDQDDQLTHDDSAHDQIIARHRAAWEAKPDDLDLMVKYVRALEAKATDDSEEEATKVLKTAFEKTTQYRFKMFMGDIQIRQFNRHLRMLRDAVKDNPGDESLKKTFESEKRKQLEFEMAEFTERVKNYPTDMKLRYELGRRLLVAKRYEEAVGAFQDAQANISLRVRCKEALGFCYVHMDWLEPAITTLKEGIEAYPLQDDALALSMKFQLMDALERNAKKLKSLEHAEEAMKVASNILQIDIRYPHIKERVNALNALIKELQSQPA